MAMMEPIPAVVKLTVLGYELTAKQNAYLNYLLPSVFGCAMYVVHFAVDLGLVYRLYKEDEAIWAGLSIFFMYLPALACFTLTVSSCDMWPEYERFGCKSFKWIVTKIIEHAFFPIWSMWRYAEKIFWSIEGVRGADEEALQNCSAPRTVEFYFFLQGFLHTIPQILLQLHILTRNIVNRNKETIDIQAASILVNICILAGTTVLYQRFKTQKVGGKDYPWFKPYKCLYDPSVDYVDGTRSRKVGIIYRTRETAQAIRKSLTVDVESTTSSDYYMQPVEGGIDEVDIAIQPIRYIRALPEDDLVGKVVSFLWWMCFLLARFFAISTFAYFYPRDVIWLLVSHFILCVAILLYDVRAYVVRRTKAVFFIFIGLVYIFCIIEFKKKFKKARLIYTGYFLLVFIENLTMCLVWWYSELEDIYNVWWFKFSFNMTLICSFLSFTTMMLYTCVNRPDKVIVGKEVISEVRSC
ncbi:PREDICTED: uncharacterized protein LOC108557701 [Nicrophorus vespilloides]|uniref:XK-related protein n=1 Tax=Nicrophorus vespilloides TaxID=110193 RepID=A0ABM1M5H5_NICVS|nr:PREDICTED: uncharacterized protein LOC108557701 [Nicrophorus vespilloides]